MERRTIIRIVITLAGMSFLFWFCMESNRVQTHEFTIDVDTRDTVMLDSLKIKLEYPDPEQGEQAIAIAIEHTLKGGAILSGEPRSYFLMDGYLIDGVYRRMRTDIEIKTDGHTLHSKKGNRVEKEADYVCYTGEKDNATQKAFAEYFFLKPQKKPYPDRFRLEGKYSYVYSQNVFSKYNLQRKCFSVRINVPQSDCVKLEINFKTPINIHSISIDPDKQEFTKLTFEQKETIEKFRGNGFSAIVETMRYEGIQAGRNMLMGVIIPMLASLLIKDVVRLVRKKKVKL